MVAAGYRRCFGKEFSPDACAKSPVSLQASCQFIFSVSYYLSTYFTTIDGEEGPYSRWGRRPEPEALKSGNALHCCCRRPRFIGPPFLPGRPRGRSASRDAFSQEITTTGGDFRRPRPPPEEHHEHRFAQHPLSKIQRADIRFLGGCLRHK